MPRYVPMESSTSAPASSSNVVVVHSSSECARVGWIDAQTSSSVGWITTSSSNCTYTATVTGFAYAIVPSTVTPPIDRNVQARLDAEQRRIQESLLERQQRQAVASRKADGLLMAFMSPDQRKQYEANKSFVVRVAKDGQVRRYLITHGFAGNVFLLNDREEKVASYCAHIDFDHPVGDNLLAQKLMLETDESRFLATANMRRLMR